MKEEKKEERRRVMRREKKSQEPSLKKGLDDVDSHEASLVAAEHVRAQV